MKPFQRNISSIPLEGAHGGAGKRQVLMSRAADTISTQIEAATRTFVAPGAVFDWHDHCDIDEFFIVVSGQGIIEYEDGTCFEYKAGDLIYNPANLSHRIEATGEETSEYFFFRVNASAESGVTSMAA